MTDQFDGGVPDWLDDEDAGGDLPDWLRSSPSSPDAGQPEAVEGESSADDSGDELPDWLNMPTADFEAAILESTAELVDKSEDDGVPDWAADSDSQAADQPQEQTYADWAREHMLEEDFDTPAWISDDVADFAEASAVDSGLTYEEWERQQDEAEYEATREPDIPLPELDMPDLLGDIDTGKPPPGGLAEAEDYVPEWFMGVEELDAADAPDWLKGADLPTGQFSAGSEAEAPRPPTSPLDAPDDLLPDFAAIMGQPAPPELPNFDAFMGEQPTPDKPSIRRLGAAPPETSDSAPLDLSDLMDEAPEKPQIRRLGDAPTARDSDAISIDEILLADDDNVPVPPDLPAASPQDEFAALFGDVIDDDVSVPPDLPEGEFAPPEDDFGDEGEPDWLQGYDADAEHAAFDAAKPAAPDYAQEEPRVLATGVLPDWFEDVDFSAVQAPPAAEETFEEAPSMEQQSPDDAFDLDALFGSPSSQPARPDTSSLMSMEGLDDLVSDEDLGFDEDMFAQFTAPPAAPLDEAASELEPADLESSGIVPDWVQQMGAAADDVVLSTGGVEEHFEQVPPVVLPNELRALRGEMTDHMMQSSARRAQISQGPLAGVDDALGIESVLSEPGQLSLGRAYDISDSQQMRLNALQGVLQAVDAETEAERIEIRYDLGGEEYEVEGTPAGAPEARRRQKRSRRRPDRLLVMLVLLVFALLPFATDQFHLAEDPPTELDEDAMPLAAAIDELGAADAETRKPVLVAVEYGPATASELDPLLEAVLWDIFVQGGRPVVTSTNPLGLLHASHVLESLASDEDLIAAAGPVESDWPELPAEAPEGIDQLSWNAVLNQYNPPLPPSNINYVVLRYLPAGAVGVRSLITSETSTGTVFTRDAYGEDTNLDIDELDSEDFAFIVVAGERYEDARIWAEQTSALDVPKFALVTAAAEPITRPYVASGEYGGILSGIRGALMYDAARNADSKAPYEPSESIDLPNPTLSRWHSAALGALVAAALIAAGTLFNIVRMIRRRREQHS